MRTASSQVSISTLVRHEWRGLTADRSLWVASVIFALLLTYAIANGLAGTATHRAALTAAHEDEGRRWSKLLSELDTIPADAPRRAPAVYDPRRPGPAGQVLATRYAALPPGALSLLAVGQSDLYPSYYRVSSRSRLTFLDTDEIENPVNLLIGRFDVAFVIVYLFPLLILALSFNILASEREQGTLALVLSHPVSLARLLWAKILARGVILGFIAVSLALAGVVASGGTWGAEVTILLALWIAVVLSYGAIWFGLAVLVNLTRHGSATCALVLAAFWLGFVLLVPTGLNVFVSTRHPVPSRVELITAMRTASNDATAKGSALLAKYYEDHPELGRANDSTALTDFLARSYTVSRNVDSTLQPLLARFDAQLARQQRLVDRFRFASPALLAHGALSDFSGTGSARYRRFRAQVEAFHAAWAGFFIHRILAQQLLTRRELEQAPMWHWQEEAPADLVRRVVPPLAALALLALLLLLWATKGASRYRPTT